MHTNVPQRRLKVWLRTFFIMSMLFIVTLGICVVVFFISSRQTGILSPVFRKVENMFATGSDISVVKNLCRQDNIHCASVGLQNSNTIRLTLDNGSVVYLSTKKDLKKQLASLQEVISQLTIKGKQFKMLDFRFDHIIVSF